MGGKVRSLILVPFINGKQLILLGSVLMHRFYDEKILTFGKLTSTLLPVTFPSSIFLLTLTGLGLAKRAAKISFKPHFTRNRTSGWQSNNIFPRLAGC